MRSDAVPNSFRSLFISDLHLGAFRCNARDLGTFLAANIAQTLFLVGDIVDLWAMRAGATWNSAHSEVVQLLIRQLQAGRRIILIPGNHDVDLLRFSEFPLPGLEIHREFEAETAIGKRFLIVHGHEQDILFGSTHGGVRAACVLGHRCGGALRALGFRRRPLRWPAVSASRRIGWFERMLVAEAKRRNCDGVICGHSHAPAARKIDGVDYFNCGDWVRHCTAVAETRSGEMKLLRWHSVDTAKIRSSLEVPYSEREVVS